MIGQAGSALDEAMLVILYHLLLFSAPSHIFQEDQFRYLFWHRGEANRLVVPCVVLSTLHKNECDVAFSSVTKDFT